MQGTLTSLLFFTSSSYVPFTEAEHKNGSPVPMPKPKLRWFDISDFRVVFTEWKVDVLPYSLRKTLGSMKRSDRMKGFSRSHGSLC